MREHINGLVKKQFFMPDIFRCLPMSDISLHDVAAAYVMKLAPDGNLKNHLHDPDFESIASAVSIYDLDGAEMTCCAIFKKHEHAELYKNAIWYASDMGLIAAKQYGHECMGGENIWAVYIKPDSVEIF